LISATLLALVVAAGGQRPADPDEGARARAWNAILAIHEESARAEQWKDEVRSDHPKYGWHDILSLSACADDTGGLSFEHVNRPIMKPEKPGGQPRTLATECKLVLREGFTISQTSGDPWILIRPYDPDAFLFAGLPGLWTGLGRSLCTSRLEARSEHLAKCADLRVGEEDGERVVLVGGGPMWSSRYEHIVEVDARTGDVLRHRTITPIWRTVVTDWQMDGWHEAGGARVPGRMTYQMWEPDLSAGQQSLLREERTAAGLPVESQWPEHGRYAEWEALRDRVLGREIPIRPAGPRQEATIAVLGVNGAVGPTRLEWPEAGKYLSAFLEAPVAHPYPDGRLPPGGKREKLDGAKGLKPGVEAKP